MSNIDIFGDSRRIPKLTINVKVKVKTRSAKETLIWNSVFGYIMKKPRTKLEFLAVSSLRGLPLNLLTLNKLETYISKEDYEQLKRVEKIFNEGLTNDVKAFILAILKLPVNVAKELTKE